jgi:hypothetical protein
MRKLVLLAFSIVAAVVLLETDLITGKGTASGSEGTASRSDQKESGPIAIGARGEKLPAPSLSPTRA